MSAGTGSDSGKRERRRHAFVLASGRTWIRVRRGEWSHPRPTVCHHGLFHQRTEKGNRPVDKVRVYFDRVGNSLTVWFDDPAKETVCEEVGDDVVVMKDRRGRVIGFEL